MVLPLILPYSIIVVPVRAWVNDIDLDVELMALYEYLEDLNGVLDGNVKSISDPVDPHL